MTPQGLRLAYTNWYAVHTAIHGTPTLVETQIVHELMDFLINCAQVSEPEISYEQHK